MAITDIRLSFLKCSREIGVHVALRLHNCAWGGYNHICNYIVLNLPLMAKHVIDDEPFVKGKKLEQVVCLTLTHEEIHDWLNKNIDIETSIAFDKIAEKFMEDM